MTEAKSTILYFTEGSSNKEYRAQLAQDGDGWVVNFQYGPRGRATNTGTKTKDPLPYDKALKVYDKLVKSKTDKGYTPDVSGAAYSGGVDRTWWSCGAFSVCDGQPTIENSGPCDGYSVSPFGRPPHPSALSHTGIGNVFD